MHIQNTSMEVDVLKGKRVQKQCENIRKELKKENKEHTKLEKEIKQAKEQLASQDSKPEEDIDFTIIEKERKLECEQVTNQQLR